MLKMTNNVEPEWKLSIRDGDHYFSDKRSQKNWEKFNKTSEEEKEIIKQKIIKRHQKLGLNENLKKELYPTLFDE